MIVLHHLTGPLAGQETQTRDIEILLGRGEDCNVILEAPTVSRSHARICFRNQWYELMDENSVHGTWLNAEGRRLEGPRRLREHDVIKVGGPDGPSMEVRFEYDRTRYAYAQAPDPEPISSIWVVLLSMMALVLVGLTIAVIALIRS